jgi:hypothetical protein
MAWGKWTCWIILTGFAVLIGLAGCKSNRSAQEEELNQLWRQGYGFSNPNADRMRKGLPVKNFDGSVD